MALKLALDTSIYAELSRGTLQPKFADSIATAPELALPITVIAELYGGFYNGLLTSNNIKNMQRFILELKVKILHTTIKTADTYGLIYSVLRKAGTPIPTNDLWIAALCLENNYTLLTRDKHFQYVDKLAAEIIE